MSDPLNAAAPVPPTDALLALARIIWDGCRCDDCCMDNGSREGSTQPCNRSMNMARRFFAEHLERLKPAP